LTKENMLC